jgi:5'(3')-deoxyribonucleotidase
MRILLDCDGVICDFVQEVLRFDNFEHSLDSITEFNIFKAWGAPERWPLFSKWIAEPGRVLNMQPLQGAKDFARDLRALGEVCIATSPYKGAPFWIQERLVWLEREFGFAPDDVFNLSRKNWIEADVLVDDALHNAQDFPGRVLLLDQPWNHAAELPPHVTRCFGYEQVLEQVRALCAS